MSYQWDAQDYARNNAGQRQWALALIQRLNPQSGETILDIGCGDGGATALVAQAVGPGGRVVGIDSAAGMIETAHQNHASDTLRFVHADARNFDLPERFDAMLSNAALHWIVDHRPVLARVARHLKPGGRFQFEMGGRGNAAAPLQAIEQMAQTEFWGEWLAGVDCPYGFHGSDEYRVWLQEAGLVCESAELISVVMRHADEAALAGWVRTTWLPYTQRIPAQHRDRFVAEVVERCGELVPRAADGSYPLQMVRLQVAGYKKPATK
ncbi:class I SAM-dependent methyltransferase [Magnetofaba australis]|uniref:Putative methyltransferase n=1 Tax=Magnetofaba australis IT-1 TaxID=1434232 RepID=A0A1Y2K1E4_9PROT|nr:class I SAM-dependent methyltransferase [Magnetofaba australis]OSM00121.1 putative methyltransferase [Magnetofaba australis IT-1]